MFYEQPCSPLSVHFAPDDLPSASLLIIQAWDWYQRHSLITLTVLPIQIIISLSHLTRYFILFVGVKMLYSL